MSAVRRKMLLLAMVVVLYLTLGIGFQAMVHLGVIHKTQAPQVATPQPSMFEFESNPAISEHLSAAQAFFQQHLADSSGHVNLYLSLNPGAYSDDNQTNSEAISYYLLWSAQQGDKKWIAQ